MISVLADANCTVQKNSDGKEKTLDFTGVTDKVKLRNFIMKFREDAFKEEDHPRGKNGQFIDEGSSEKNSGKTPKSKESWEDAPAKTDKQNGIIHPTVLDSNTFVFREGDSIKFGRSTLKFKGEITANGVITIAKGCKIKQLPRLLKIGGSARTWMKKGGTVELEISGKMKKMQMHFFYEESVGCIGTKVLVDESKAQRAIRKNGVE